MRKAAANVGTTAADPSADRRRPRWQTLASAYLFLLITVGLPIPGLALEKPTASPPPASARPLTVVLDDNYPPYIFRDSRGKLQGYLIDHWKLWEAKTGTPVIIQASDWSLAQARMRNRQADVIDTIFKNSERQKTLDFGAPYTDVPVSIYSHRGIGGITSIETLRGFLVGVKASDACIDMLKINGVHSIQTYPSYEALVQGAIRNEVRVFCLDEPPANYFLYREHAEQTFRRAFRLYSGEFHRAYAKGDTATRRRVEAGFATFSAQEKKQLSDKWMGASLERRQIPPFFFYTLGALIGIGALLALWVASLRRAVRQRTEDLVATLHAIPDTLFECDSKGHCFQCYANADAKDADLSETPLQQLAGKNIIETLPPVAAKNCLLALKEAEKTGHSSGAQIELETRGQRRNFELSIARKGNRRDHDARFIMLVRDITERVEAEATIRKLAHFDPLTGLPNRVTLNDRIKAAISRAKRQRAGFALMFLDIDRFKRVNDTLGHHAGDQLLIQFSRRVRETLRDEDTLSRLGGDEFILILPDASPEGAARVAEKLTEAMKAPYALGDRMLHCTASIGIAFYPEDGETFEALSMHADTAMYQAKNAGRQQFSFSGATT